MYDYTPKVLAKAFQSPQWGDNSKVKGSVLFCGDFMFQSPQWGDNSKGKGIIIFDRCSSRFSPRNGEIILKINKNGLMDGLESFSPRNGEIILKNAKLNAYITLASFSPRNGEIILKGTP